MSDSFAALRDVDENNVRAECRTIYRV